MLAFQRMMIGTERTGDVRNKDRHERNWDSILITSVKMSKITIKIVRPTVRGTLVGVHLAIRPVALAEWPYTDYQGAHSNQTDQNADTL